MADRINVTKTFMPPIEEYEAYLKGIWERGHLTNQGVLVKRLQMELQERLEVRSLHFVTNGTAALQISLHAVDALGGEVITTPFSYVATTSSILWEHCEPVFVDIDPETLCIDPSRIEAAITPRTRAIMPVHVFGNPCDVEAIQAIADKHGLKVIYDAAHAFGVRYKGESLLQHGDIAVCSFHATKLFHTIEGGGIVVNDDSAERKVELMKRFGHEGDEHIMLGINAKASEFQAAMGLCNLKYIDDIIAARRRIVETYDALLGGIVRRPVVRQGTESNGAYYPVILKSEARLEKVMAALAELEIFPRRYFYPSLNTLPYLTTKQVCPVSEDIAVRILCLPLYVGLEEAIINQICEVIKREEAA